MTKSAVRAFYTGVLAFLIGLLPAVEASAPEVQRPETEESPDTRTVEQLAAVSEDGGRAIAIEIHRKEPRPEWWPTELHRDDDLIVLSIMDKDEPGSRWEKVAFPPIVLRQQGDISFTRVEAIHADSVVLTNCDDMYGIYCTSIKQFFDADARRALGQVKFEPLGESALLQIGNAVYFATKRLWNSRDWIEAIVARFSPGGPELVFGHERKTAIATIPGPIAECRTLRLNPIRAGSLLDSSITPKTDPSCFVQAASSPPLWTFDFPLDNYNARGHYERLSGIVVQDGESYRAFPLSQSTPQDLGLYRSRFAETQPAYARNIDSFTILESIEAFAVHRNRLWFGKSFYDGEGLTGVGSLGYFDIERRSYQLIRLPEIADWSTSAILIENDRVWIGLTGHPEGADYSGGLLRYEMETGDVRIYPISEVITDILQHKDALYVATERAQLYVLENDTVVAHYSVEPALNGGFEIRSKSTRLLN